MSEEYRLATVEVDGQGTFVAEHRGWAKPLADILETSDLDRLGGQVTGTPAGVGNGRKPPEFLNAGDEIRVEIGNLGALITPIVAPLLSAS